jgi:hypoxanthine phosphoribosyltransferase
MSIYIFLNRFLTKVSALIAKINHESENTVRQRLKEWYKEGQAKDKIGNKNLFKKSGRGSDS